MLGHKFLRNFKLPRIICNLKISNYACGATFVVCVPLAYICPPRSNFQQAKICHALPFPRLQNSLKLQVWNCFYVWIGYRIYIEFLQQELFSLPRHLQHARASMKQRCYRAFLKPPKRYELYTKGMKFKELTCILSFWESVAQKLPEIMVNN